MCTSGTAIVGIFRSDQYQAYILSCYGFLYLKFQRTQGAKTHYNLVVSFVSYQMYKISGEL